MQYRSFTHHALFYRLLLILLSLLSFFPIWGAKELLDRDIHLVIGPLYNVGSFKDYYDLFISKNLTDIQPIRDLFLLIDIKFTRIIGFQFYGFSNWVIWISSCLVAEKIIRKFPHSSSLLKILLLILACHPMLAWVISWPLAKKHLLACFFILLASLKAIEFKQEKKRTGLQIFLFYCLSLFSQPILIFWPIAFFFYLGKEKNQKRSISLLCVLFLTAMVIGVLNQFYYSQLVTLYFGTNLNQPPILMGLAQRLFAISRGFTQIIFPISFAANYSLTNPLGFIGLPVILVVLIIKLKQIKPILFFLLLMSLPLLATNVKISSVFLSDTYLLFSLLGLFFTILYQSQTEEKSRLKIFVLSLILLLAIPKSIYESSIAANEHSYFLKSYQREPECKNILSLAEFNLRKAHLEQFITYSGTALMNRCFLKSFYPQFMINDMYAFRLFLDEKLTAQSKLDAFRKSKIVSPDVLYLQIILLNKLDQTEQSEEIFSELPLEALRYKDSLRKIIKMECEACPKI